MFVIVTLLVVIVYLLVAAAVLMAGVWIFNRLAGYGRPAFTAGVPVAPAAAPGAFAVGPMPPPVPPLTSDVNPFAAPFTESAAPIFARTSGGVPMPSFPRAIGICFLAGLLSLVAASALIALPLSILMRDGPSATFMAVRLAATVGNLVISYFVGVVIRRGLLPARWGQAFAIHGIEYAIGIGIYVLVFAGACVVGAMRAVAM